MQTCDRDGAAAVDGVQAYNESWKGQNQSKLSARQLTFQADAAKLTHVSPTNCLGLSCTASDRRAKAVQAFAPGCQKGVTASMILTNGKSLVTGDVKVAA